MFSIRQTAEIIDKLIELTQHNRITWESQEPIPSMVGPDTRVDVVYTTNHIGRNIRVYHQHFINYSREEQPFWDERMVIEFIDNSGALLGKLPKTPNAWELLEAIQFQNPQINGFYDDLFHYANQ